MKTTEFNKSPSSHQLNENLYKKFGVKVNFEKYNREQLEDARNKIRTEIHQLEAKSNFNDLLSNESYQKNKQLVGLLNTRIKEMLGESIAVMERKLSETDKKKDKFDPLKHVKNPTPGEKKAAKDVKRGSYADRAAMLKSAEADGRLKESHSIYKRHVAIVNESLAVLLAEDEEGKAKAITAAGDMVNDYTSWMQRVGQYQTKTMIELADAIKADFGAAEAEAFKQAVGPALSATLEVLTQQREAVSNAVAVLAGEATPDMGMGMEPGMDAGMAPEPSMDIAAPDDMNAPAPAGDEFGASDAAAGVGTTGREMRESRFARKLAESHSIMSKLAK